MNCDYCYIYNSKDTSWKDMPKVMSPDVAHALVRRIIDLYHLQQTKPQIVFHGGEPLLAGVNFLEEITASILDQIPLANISIQSNGTIYNKRFESFLNKYKGKVNLSVSVDGFKEENDLHRRGLKGQSIYDKIERTISRATNAELVDNILLVMDTRHQPERIFDYIMSCGVKNFNILLQDGDHNCLPANKITIDSTKVGEWLWKLFSLYATASADFRIKLFDDISKGLLKSKRKITDPTTSFSLCTITVDTNGDIKQSDTFRINGNGADVFGKFNVKKHSLTDVMNSEENISYIRNFESLSDTCLACKYLNVCGGGYPNHRLNGANFNYPSIYCSDYKYLFEKMNLVL